MNKKYWWQGMRFKEVAWRWTAVNLFFTWHYGRNPVSHNRFLYVGVGPFLGFDFYWPKERKPKESVEPVIWDDIGISSEGRMK
jgi:hypothetical protein